MKRSWLLNEERGTLPKRVVKFLENLSSTLPWKIKDFWGSALKKPWFFQLFNPWICSINLENLVLILGLKFKFFQVFTLKKPWISRFLKVHPWNFLKKLKYSTLDFSAPPWKCLSNPCVEIWGFLRFWPWKKLKFCMIQPLNWNS